MTEDQLFCESVLAHWAGGRHHLPHVYQFGTGVCINFSGDLSTFDFNRLTQLVLAAHRWAVRIEIASSGPGMVKIIAHRRDPKGEKQSERHPDLETLKTMAENAQKWQL